MPKILIVEDSDSWQERYQSILSEHTLLQAYTGKQGRELFQAHQTEIDIVILDGYLSSKDPECTTIKLATEIRGSGFQGPMIAASSDIQLRSQLIRQGGCNYVIGGRDKEEVLQIINRILERSTP